jgi:MFS family permease
MFLTLSIFSLLGPLTALLLKDDAIRQDEAMRALRVRKRPGLGLRFYMLFLASLATMLAGYVFIMSRSFVMAELGFGVGAITTTSAIGEVPLLPFPLLLGCLSDRLGRKGFLIIGSLAAAAGLYGLTASASLWHFWIVSTLVTAAFVTGGVGSALVVDVVPREALGKALSLFGATSWIAGILGCAGAGCALQYLGPVLTFVVSALLPLAAVALLIAIRPGRANGNRPSTRCSKQGQVAPKTGLKGLVHV